MAATRPCTYEVIVQIKPIPTPQHEPIRFQEHVPVDLCTRAVESHARRLQTTAEDAVEFKEFMRPVLEKRDPELMAMKDWSCWSCRKKATSLTHNTMSYLHSNGGPRGIVGPFVVDFCYPVCRAWGECDVEAREMWRMGMGAMGIRQSPN